MSTIVPVPVPLGVQGGRRIPLKVGGGKTVSLGMDTAVRPALTPHYTGDYEVTPTESEQLLQTTGLIMDDDVTVHGIPADYVGSAIDRRDSSDLSASGPTVSVPAGYYGEAASKAVASGSAAPPASISGSYSSIYPSQDRLTFTKNVTVTPVVTEGYITAGTAGSVAVSLTAVVATKGGETITPGTSDRTIAAATYLTGNQVIKGDPDLIAANISENANIFGVQGTLPVYPDGDLLAYGNNTVPMVGAGQVGYMVI